TDTATMAANVPSAGTGIWTIISGPNIPLIDSLNDPATIFRNLVPGTYSFGWAINNGVCSSITDTVFITIYALPTVAAAGSDSALCNSTSITLYGNSPVNGTGLWNQVSGPGLSTIADPTDPASNVTGLTAGTFSFQWTITNGVCPVSADTMLVTIFDLPSSANAGADQFLCADTSTTMSATTPGTGSGTWTMISGPTAAVIDDTADPSTPISNLVPGTYLFQWMISNGVCPGTMDTVSVVVYDFPSAANAGGDQHLCNDSVITLSGNSPATGNGLWSMVSGPSLALITNAADSVTSVTGSIPGIYSFQWSVTNGTCVSSDDVMQVTIDALPSNSNAGTDQVICGDSVAIISANNPLSGNGTWSQVSGPTSVVISFPGSPAISVNALVQGTYSFAWTIGNGICPSSTDTTAVTIFSTPAVPDAGPDLDLCNISAVSMSGSTPSAGSGTW